MDYDEQHAVLVVKHQCQGCQLNAKRNVLVHESISESYESYVQVRLTINGG